MTLLFTDSNPLVALLARPFASWLPTEFQLVGPWILLCFALHALCAVLLLRDHAPSFVALWCGVALFLLVPTLANRFVHAKLMAHWLILWGLWLFLDTRRAGDLRWWAALMIVAALVHNYLLLMVAAIWASTMLERFVHGDAGRRVRLVTGSAVILAVVALIARAHGAGGSFEVTGSYGAFAMSLDAPWNPGNASYSTFLPAIEQRQGRGFEGFQYLGLGLLILIPIAMVTRIAKGRASSDLGRLVWLAPALIVLTALAITPAIDIAGQKLLRLPIPAAFAPALDMVRASGRLFWPVAYALVLVTVRLVFRLRHDRATLVLASATALQLLDLSGLLRAVHAASADRRPTYVRTPSSEWTRLVAAVDDVTLAPADAIADLQLYQEIAWRAASARKPIRHVYAARTAMATRQRLMREDLDVSHGRLQPRRLYVLLPGTPVPDGAARRLRTVDGIRVIAPEKR
ncbi:DUF6311 domain-containing protein [Sphingomonas sp. Y38-1Y]|uniref:DUF6311 domain-containing protein n=1 Tax=Sphingomonas sp. Y38-1Y TaxID=3078265 RepID=UPI0028EA0D0F|nr:DUF6311 domain-containing protein [Sphingomonas sp. Y38-1Y]